jgi:hypothetical protein
MVIFIEGGLFGELALLDTADDRLIDASCVNGAIANHISASLREEESKHDQENTGEDCKEPKNGSPSKVLRKDAANGWTKGWTA